ncbi:hypothetical protein NEHOM01_1269 [Nematocida homosporus]|uniref:uncharacterized protein n=1 Tax=Nematocida homosporus TaxID=1912981 RepID=UPI0022206842|nr:uncharacterized protein NEHOM01_1269 [Nematocida homosporus]KAI5186087.1 hypothetical protein NEHOM01_1269 [Nematocida homosporus]
MNKASSYPVAQLNNYNYFQFQQPRNHEEISRVISKDLSFIQRLKRILCYPIRFFIKQPSKHHYIELIRPLGYLLEKRAYLSHTLILKATAARDIAQENIGNPTIPYQIYTNDEIFTFLSNHINKKIGRLVPKKSFQQIIRADFIPTYSPEVIQNLFSSSNIYRLYALHMLIRLFVSIDANSHLNKIDSTRLLAAFVPLFMGARYTCNLKAKRPKEYQALLSKWQQILRYVPKERHCQ